MSMSNNQAKEPLVYVRQKWKKRSEEVVINVETFAAQQAQQEFSSKEIGQTSPKTQSTEPNKLLKNKEANTIKKGRTKSCSNSSKLNTRRSKGRSAGNAKVDNKEDKRKTWKPQTQEETNSNQLTLVHAGNIDYVTSQLDFAKDLGEAAQRFAHTRVCSLKKSLNDNTSWSTYNANAKGKEIYQERNNTWDLADFYQRRNKGIIISERSVNSRAEEMARFLGTSNNPSSGQNLQFQDMNQVRPRHHKPRIIVHPSKIIGPSRFSQTYDQNMQRTSVSAPYNFSLMKLIMDNENRSTLTDQELLYARELLSTQGLSSSGQRVQQFPCSQVGNHQNMQRTSGSGTSNFSFVKLLTKDEDSTDELYEKEFLSTRYSLSSDQGQRVQEWPCSQLVGNYQFNNSLQQINLHNFQHQVLQQPQQISYIDLLKRDDISYVDLLTREDISWT